MQDIDADETDILACSGIANDIMRNLFVAEVSRPSLLPPWISVVQVPGLRVKFEKGWIQDARP